LLRNSFGDGIIGFDSGTGREDLEVGEDAEWGEEYLLRKESEEVLAE